MGGRVVRAAGAPAAHGVEELPEPSWRFLARRGLPQFATEAVVPVVVFYGAWRAWGLGGGIAASTVVSLVLAAWLARRGHAVGLVVLGALVVLIQAAVALAAHSATVYLAQPVVLSGLWSLAYAGSVVVGRPLIGVFACAWYPFPQWFRESEPFRREFGMQSLVWAAYCLARAVLRVVVLLHSGIGSFVLVSLVTGPPLLVALVAWGLWHARHSFARVDVAAPVA
jgi:Protein of unknown function (DUF3159)